MSLSIRKTGGLTALFGAVLLGSGCASIGNGVTLHTDEKNENCFESPAVMETRVEQLNTMLDENMQVSYDRAYEVLVGAEEGAKLTGGQKERMACLKSGFTELDRTGIQNERFGRNNAVQGSSDDLESNAQRLSELLGEKLEYVDAKEKGGLTLTQFKKTEHGFGYSLTMIYERVMGEYFLADRPIKAGGDRNGTKNDSYAGTGVELVKDAPRKVL